MNLNTTKPQKLNRITSKNVNATSGYGTTPLHFATLSSNSLLVDFLLSKSANITSNAYGETPLHWACKSGTLENVLRLMNDNTITKPDNDSNAPLHWAAEYDHSNIAGVLLDAGADINCLNMDDESPLEIACFWNNSEVVDCFLSRGAELRKGFLIASQNECTETINVIMNHLTPQLPKNHEKLPKKAASQQITRCKQKGRKRSISNRKPIHNSPSISTQNSRGITYKELKGKKKKVRTTEPLPKRKQRLRASI